MAVGRRPNTALVLNGEAFSSAFSPDDPAYDALTGELDLRVFVQMADWTPPAISVFVTKWAAADGTFTFGISTGGLPRLAVSADGSAVTAILATTAPAISDGQPLGLRVTFVGNDGGGNRVTNFYTGPSISGPWTQLGTTITTAGTIALFQGTAQIEVGTHSLGTAQRMTGLVFAAEIRDGIDGNVLTSPNFGSLSSRQPSFVDDQSRHWTIATPALVGVV